MNGGNVIPCLTTYIVIKPIKIVIEPWVAKINASDDTTHQSYLDEK